MSGAVTEPTLVFWTDVGNSLASECGAAPVSLEQNRQFFDKVIEANSPARLEKLALTDLHVLPALQRYDSEHKTAFAIQARMLIWRFAETFVAADDEGTTDEEAALDEFRKVINGEAAWSLLGFQPENFALLSDFKATIDDAKHAVEITLREGTKEGSEPPAGDVALANVATSRVYGEPRHWQNDRRSLLASIYKSLGILSKGHLVEADRSGLVAGYLGQTAIKVQEIVKASLGGVLFIDEAYSLVERSDDSFGQEAVDTLLQLMEDHRNDLIVIVAGYTEKMNKFLLSNPGMKSRFNKYIVFDDYAPNELVLIFESFCSNAGFDATPTAKEPLACSMRAAGR